MCNVCVRCEAVNSPLFGAEDFVRELIRDAVGDQYTEVAVFSTGLLSFSVSFYRGKDKVASGTIRRSFGRWQVIADDRAIADLPAEFDAAMRRDFVLVTIIDGDKWDNDDYVPEQLPLFGMSSQAALAWARAKYFGMYSEVRIDEDGDVVVELKSA